MTGGGEAPGKICPAIVGPTAAGKTALVTALAQRLPIQVISLDSRQIYHGLRIGTAQPTAEELALCRHHLIDFVSPDEKYSAVRFREDFTRIYQQIVADGGLPILAGGAGMYLSALRDGFMDIPGNSSQKLKEVRTEIETWSPQVVRQKLSEVDPESCQRLHVNDHYRIQRALEIYFISGHTMTELTAEQKPDPCLGLAFPAFVLQREVPLLDQRIAHRTALMLKEGWIAETEAALEKHDPAGPGLQSIGYREIVQFLAGQLDKKDLTANIILVTRQYAKRQRTWFRNLPESYCDHPDSPELVERIAALLNP